MHRTLEPYHGLVYFAPEAMAAYGRLGAENHDVGYFGSRAAAFGPVPADVVIATFFNFNPVVVEAAIPAAWQLARPAAWIEARRAGIAAALERILGERIREPELDEALALATEAASACTTPGRPLFAAHRSLDWPHEPHVALWHALTLLREHRGDGHIACLVEADIGGCEALVLHGGMGQVPPSVLQATRQWTDVEWRAAIEGLAERGLVDSSGALTIAGRELREDIEARTDQLAMPPWRALGESRSLRLRELVRPMSRAIVDSGAFRLGS